MQKTVIYLFPQMSKASELKVIQDKTSPIRAIRFNRDTIKLVESLDGATNPGLYFFFDSMAGKEEKMSVGQTINGIIKLKHELNNMDESSRCILFVTDNNSFDKISLDALEYLFACKIENSKHELVKNPTHKETPDASIYEQPYIYTFINQIEFLLSAEGIIFETVTKRKTNQGIAKIKSHIKYYFPKETKYAAKIFIENNRYFIAEGSFIRRPYMSTHNSKAGGIYTRNNRIIDELLETKKITIYDDGFKLLTDVPFRTSSITATLISGLSVNGRDFF